MEGHTLCAFESQAQCRAMCGLITVEQSNGISPPDRGGPLEPSVGQGKNDRGSIAESLQSLHWRNMIHNVAINMPTEPLGQGGMEKPGRRCRRPRQKLTARTWRARTRKCNHSHPHLRRSRRELGCSRRGGDGGGLACAHPGAAGWMGELGHPPPRLRSLARPQSQSRSSDEKQECVHSSEVCESRARRPHRGRGWGSHGVKPQECGSLRLHTHGSKPCPGRNHNGVERTRHVDAGRARRVDVV